MLLKKQVLTAIFLILITGIAYIPATKAGFIWDDLQNVERNPNLKDSKGLWRTWVDIKTNFHYYPLTHTSFWIEYQAWKLSPIGYHIDNVALHCISVLLLWRILAMLGIPGAWLVATIFAIHPVHVESVAWITERKNTLSGVFYFASFLSYLRFYEYKYRGCYILSFLFYILALMSKTAVCSLPVMILFMIWWKEARLKLRDWGFLLPFFIAAVTLGLLTLWIERHFLGAVGPEWNFTFMQRCLIASHALWFYVWKLIFPLNLTFIYPRWDIDTMSLFQWLPVALTIVVFSLFWLLRKRIGRGPFACITFFVITLAPAIGFINHYFMRYSFVGDHFQYLASIGIIILAARGMWYISALTNNRYAWIKAGCIGLMVVILGLLTWKQCFIYKDEQTLWQDTLNKNPDAGIAYNNLGIILAAKGEDDKAMNAFEKAAQKNPNFAIVHSNLGAAYMKKGMYDEAIAEYMKAVDINPPYALTYFNLGVAYGSKGMYDEAISNYLMAFTIDPNFTMAYKDFANAIVEFRKVSDINLNLTDAYNSLGNAYAKRGMYDEAIGEYTKSIGANPNLTKVYNNLAMIYYFKQQYDKAIEYYDKAIGSGWETDSNLLKALEPYRK